MKCPRPILTKERSDGMMGVALFQCDPECELWNSEHKCCNEVAQTIILEKYLKLIHEDLYAISVKNT